MKKRILVVTLLCMAMTVAYAQTYNMPSPNSNGGAIQSQQIMPTRNYNGTVYEPFSTSTPSEQSAVGAAYSPAQAPGGPRRGKITGPDTPPSEESPIGEPWILLVFALLFGGAVFLKARKTKTTIEINHNTTNMNNNTPMKNNIVNKTSLTLLLLLTLGVGQMWGYTLYLYTGSFTNWENDNAGFRVWTGSENVNFTSLGNHWWSCTTTRTGTMYFKRTDSSHSSDWNEFSVASISSSNNCVKVTNWTAGSAFTARTITISAGANGSVSPSSTIASSSVRSKDNFTATPNANYAFVNWTTNNSNATLNDANSATTYVTTASGNCTVTANFAPQWNIMGSGTEMGSWGTYNQLAYVSSNTFSGTITLAANTTYEFKVVDRRNNAWYGYGSSKGDLSFVGQTAESAALSTGTEDIRLMTAGAGTYTFTWNSSTKKLTVTYPTVTHPSSDYIYYKNTKNWTNVYGYVYGGTTAIWVGPKLESFNFDGTDYYFVALGNNTDIVFNQGSGTNQDDCKGITGNKGKYYDPSSSSWRPFTATLTLDHQGPTNTPAPNSITVTYGASTNLTGDVITTSPAKTGYTFGGYYTSAGGGGSLLIGTNENVVASVANYTDGSKNWIRTGSSVSTTVYAKWTQSVTLDEQGATTSGTTSKSVIYNSASGLSTMITRPSKTGYDFGGYYTAVAGGGSQIIGTTGAWKASVTGYTDSDKKWIKPSGATTIYAYWTQSVTLNANTAYHGSGSNKTATAVWNGTALTSFTATAANTGYELEGYYTNNSGGTKVLNADGTFAADNVTNYITSGKWTKAGTTTLYAQHNAKNYTVTLDKNEGDTDGSVTTTYNANTTNSFIAAGRAGFTCDGYFTAADGGTKVINADGTLVDGSVSTWLSSGYWIKDGANLRLYAHWTENVVNYTVTYGVKAAQSSLGSLSCATTTGSTPVSSGGEVVGGTNVTFTASPIAGYEVDAWYSDAACTSRIVAAGYYTSTYAPTINENTTVYVTFKKIVYTITYSPSSAPTGCTYTTKPTSCTYGNTATIVITPTAGYSVSVSARDASSNVVSISNPSTNTYTFTQPASAVTVTVTATENKVTLTPTVSYDHGSSNYTASSSRQVGVATTTTLTCSSPNAEHYTFAGWTLTNLTVTSGSVASTSVTVRITDPSQAIAAVANYEEVLTTPYVIKGGTAITGGTAWTTEIAFTKKSGESTGSIAYAEIPISVAVGDGADANYNFKVVNGSTWYGLSGEGDWWYSSSSGEQPLVVDNQNIQLRANVVGTYTAKLDYSTPASPTITITWPVALSIYRSNPNDATNVGDHAWNSMPSSTSYRWLLDLEANTTYEFKINDKGTYYGNNTTIETGFNNRNFSTGTNDTKLITKSAGTFTLTWNATDHQLTLQYPKSVMAGASPASVYDEGTTTLTGYASELGSGSHTITYEFFKGTTLTDAYKVGTETNTVNATYQQASHNVDVDFDGNATSQVYTIRIKESGNVLATNTVTVYRKWDIYVHDVASWGGMYSHMWGNGETTWPGNTCSLYNGSSSWYIVTIDAKYPHFQLNCNNCTNTMRTYGGDDAYTPNITTFTPGSYWYTEFHDHGGDGHDYYTLHSITLSNPTVTLSASVANCKDITLTGTVTDCGGDGSFASDMKEVYFQVGGTKNAATTVSTTGGTFTKTLSNATAGATNTLQAFAENIHGTGASSTLHYTNVTLDRQGGTTGTTAVTAVENMAMPADATAPGKAGYTFGGYYASAGGEGKQYYTDGMASANTWDQTTATKTIYAKWTANTWYVRFNANGGTGSMSNESFTYDAAAQALTSNTFTKTGYAFSGWATTAERASAGTVDYTDGQSVRNLTGTANGIVDVFAVWTPKNYTVTLDKQTEVTGYGGSAGTAANPTVTYDAVLPAISGTAPTAANGYGFMGFYTEALGAGVKVINANLTWEASVEGYTDASSHWIHDGDVTLYAYYKMAEITIELEEAIVAPWTAEDPSTVTATPTLTPTPEGNTKICWFLLQNNNNPVDPQPTFTPGEGNSVSFPAPTVSGNYKVVATLRTGTSCDGGDLLDADTVVFTVAGEHTVTILYKCGDDVIKASTTSPGKPLEGTSITAPDIIGYSFHHWVLGDGISLASGTAGSAGSAGTPTISYTAIYDGHITAVYTKKRLIYFNNTLGWSDVYVYFYKDGNYWDNANGTGTDPSYYSGSHNSAHKGHMQPIEEGSSIYYFDAEGASIPSGYTNVAFTEKQQDNCWYFYDNNKVVRRGDYNSTQLPMFVPLAGQTGVEKNSNQAVYYNEGYWMNYPENTGYWLKIYSSTALDAPTLQTIPFEFTTDKTLPMNLTVELEAGRTYGFEIYRNDNSYHGISGTTFKIGDSGDEGQTVRAVTGAGRIGLKTSVAGDYIFKLGFGNSGGYKYLIGVHYPVAVNDYRIVYNDRIQWSHETAHDAEWHHPSRAIHKENGAKDTVSFYVSKAAGASASMKFQYASAISNEGVVTWTDVAGAGGTIDLSDIENSGVYNFILTQSAVSISVEKIEPYTGAYYIRTDCAGSTKWDNYRAADHQMTYSEFSKSRETNKFGDLFSHYFTKWCPRGTNIKFCIANDYSSCVSDTLIADECFDGSISDFDNVDEYGTLKSHGEGDATADPYSANIRFMYDESNNRIKRAYVAASTNVTKRFLVLQGDANLKDKDGNAIPATAYLEANAVLFQDDQNWIYETTVKAIPGARIRIYANYMVGVVGAGTQFFCGASGTWDNEHTVELIGGSGLTPMLVRVIYDFKTNRLVCAWMPDGSDIIGNNAINADIMVVREHQDAAQTITFANDESKLSSVKTVYGAMKFNRWVLNNRQHPEDINPEHCRAAYIESDLTTYHNVLTPGEQKSIYERSLYFISFPFRVKLSEVFGFGKYWDEWYIEYYDGLNRAKNGYWMDSPPNWKYVTPDMLNSFYLEPNVGYILGLDLDFMQAENTTFWANGICNVELYFPSQESIETIGRTAVTMPALSSDYECTINRNTAEGDRRVKDSYWRCIGVPGYSSYNNTLTVDGTNTLTWQTNTAWREDFKDYPFLYEWNMTDNTLTAQSTNRYNFKAMHAYLVQNGNEIHWSAISATPVSPIVARERAASKSEYMWRLTLERDGEEEDQAFVRMTDEEDVTDGFDFGQDLAKEYNNARSDIYTYIGYERAAANSMPLHTEETTSIPVGVSIEKDGEYTFAMPDGTSGVGITLVDSETGARTNLSAGFTYTVNFEKGDYNNRLYLEISPVSQISTGVGAVSDQSSEIRKVVIDGLLYIVKDGQMYDATGKHCK